MTSYQFIGAGEVYLIAAADLAAADFADGTLDGVIHLGNAAVVPQDIATARATVTGVDNVRENFVLNNDFCCNFEILNFNPGEDTLDTTELNGITAEALPTFEFFSTEDGNTDSIRFSRYGEYQTILFDGTAVVDGSDFLFA